MAAIAKDSAKFVFTGTVQRTKAATLKAITDTDRTIVVRVDDVARAPEVLRGVAGKEITVQLAKGERVKEGQTAVFYTNGWLFGESLAVQSLGHEPARASHGARTAATPDAAQAHVMHEVRQRAAGADLVITGKVVAVSVPEEQARAAATAAAPPSPKRQPISEHDPFWNEAVVQVEKVHKGPADTRQVVVRFPSSTDVRWRHAPRFRTGEEGVFLLRQDAVSGLEHSAAGMGLLHTTKGLGLVGTQATPSQPPRACTALHETDFVPLDRQAEVVAAIDAVRPDGVA
jgi:hypothetical protein